MRGMEKTKPILYGVADYAEIRRANAWFIDRTAKIRDLEAMRYAMFLRPRVPRRRLLAVGRSMMKYSMRVLTSSLCAAFAAMCACAFAGGDGFPPPCDPVPVKKAVKVVRREITVSIIGLARPAFPGGGKTSVEACFRYWKAGMDKEICNKPDLIVLPEGVDSWKGANPADKFEWVRKRGDLLLKEFQKYAREHRAYIVFNSYRQRKDGRFANSSYMLDRDGDVVAVYDKVYPTPGEILWKELPIVPGDGPVTADADFGRVGFVVCFDLNFRDLIEAYRREKPDVICFSSAYHGDFWQRAWALTCRSYFVGSTLGELSKDVWGPSGEAIFHTQGYFKTGTVRINTNCRVCHLDDNWGALQQARAKYGQKVEVRNPGSVGCVTFLSNDPSVSVDKLIKEFGLILWDDYYDRSVKLRGGAVMGR